MGDEKQRNMQRFMRIPVLSAETPYVFYPPAVWLPVGVLCEVSRAHGPRCSGSGGVA